ncbi:Na+/H+ antiporter NhaC family protein [Paenibacillus chondroitinus]|uniref:Na+/H+ antiporter NhaC family protein n=1 Tax=Paenibacillus chondroitinus TaxID=59842 RepID=A0ABU6D4M2_9BACL|nr:MULTISPECIES: Na+/H+ antiporter NhaC family protein [Paenibacillus]MCY9658312.1 sodium:proton antiporter [Paenibacillus anseongense]MEB4792689.1 Na+/H+ antiporter NhaC family protein [Paenibacillus chondroitinus]
MLTNRQLGVTILITILGLAAAYVLHIALAIGFSFGLITLIVIVWRGGAAFRGILRSMWEGVTQTKEVMWILALVGVVIPTWTASGTIPYMIDLGLRIVDPSYFLTFSFALSVCISMLLGTSTGTLSSVGIPLIGLAMLLQIPLPMVAGALVSGAFVGDRTSPFSSANRLVASSTGVTVKELFKALLPTTIGAGGIALVFFLFCDMRGKWHQEENNVLSQQFGSGFNYSIWLLVPVLLLLLSILLRFKTRNGFLLSIASAIGIGLIFQGVTWEEWLHAMWFGYHSMTFDSLQTKGLSSMVELIVLIALAGAFNGILEENRVLQAYMQKLLGGSSTSLFAATIRTGLFGLGLGLVSCTQTLPIMMTGRSLLPFWKERFPRSQLARVVADSSLILAAMIPWNMLAIVCGTIVGVPVEHYISYAPFLWALPLCTMMWSYGWGRRGRAVGY